MQVLYKISYIILFLSLSFLYGCLEPSKTPGPPSLTSDVQNYVKVKDGSLFYQTFGLGSRIIVLHGGPGLDQVYL